jgi:hypothetical protein
MEKAKKELSSTAKILIACGGACLVFLFFGFLAVAVSDDPVTDCEPVEVIKEVEVEKIVYQDNQKTLDELEYHKQVACSFTMVYPSMFEAVKAYASDYGLSRMITDDSYFLEETALSYMSLYCE